ncbi:MAG: DUF3014 domain-containing protein [Betaproteobacteria bacterium]
MPTNALRPDPDFTVSPGLPDSDRPNRHPSGPGRTGGARVAAGVALLLMLATLAAYFLWPRAVTTPPPVATPAPASPARPSKTAAAIENPIDQVPAASAVDRSALPPLPSLDDSDQVARDVIETTLNGDAYLRLLVPTTLIRHIVATIDNLPRKTIATRILPVNPAPGTFAAASVPGGMAVAPDNARRYALHIEAAEAVDTARLAQFYVRLYPLFQQAYAELGYPNAYFNDRLIAVIDHLLATPELDAPPALAQPKVLFEFSDPELENLSAGQKILVRIGTPNERRLKSKLREIRKALSVSATKPPAETAGPGATAAPQARDTSAPSASAPPRSPNAP